ncbi:MAG: cytochrome c maturation protein CcmE [Sulfuriflexus sp.]|nr:cytochrome c maturation protein CcmE [Sulfuriflexus sp.]
MKPRHKKISFIALAVFGLSAVTLLILNTFSSNIVFFHSPTDISEGKAPINQTFRLGGMVKDNSVKHNKDGLKVSFTVTDTIKDINVTYKGILPDLFREGQGVVVQGKLLQTGEFKADQVLAKHDENYMPPEAKAAMEQAARTLLLPKK